ncbi:MAG: TonB-dependent receptor, partial [Muribaculaceae bacterium]|nr:TonB-dependent receptor [Muribaculaceae bacterium]
MRYKSLCRIITIFLTVAFTSIQAFAYTVSGLVVDEENSPLPAATVRLVTDKDSTYVAAVTTTGNGRFSIQGIKDGKYKIIASYVGYSPATKEVSVNGKNNQIGTIALEPSSIQLKEATVTGIRTPIKVMQDTVEFNADSYKTQPNAVVEDLLKRLPGVEVGSDGKITANGKEVTKILVDGKEFFSDDPTVASRNLPVDMVDKLQVVDRKSDLARITGVDDGEEETVINLTVKKGMKNGWFGNAEAGYGTNDRYAANFNVNRFWNDNQITFLGSFNNINQLGFSDGTAGRFRRFGGSTGITTSEALGINFNVGNKEIFRVGGDVMYSHSERDTRERRERQYLFADSTSYEASSKKALDRGHNIRADFRVQWNPDSSNTFEFRPNISININRSSSIDSALTSAGDASRTPVTRSFNDAFNKGNSFEFGGEIIYNHKFRSRPGRSFSIHANYRLSNVRERDRSFSENYFLLLQDLDAYDQYANNHNWSNT